MIIYSLNVIESSAEEHGPSLASRSILHLWFPNPLSLSFGAAVPKRGGAAVSDRKQIDSPQGVKLFNFNCINILQDSDAPLISAPNNATCIFQAPPDASPDLSSKAGLSLNNLNPFLLSIYRSTSFRCSPGSNLAGQVIFSLILAPSK